MLWLGLRLWLLSKKIISAIQWKKLNFSKQNVLHKFIVHTSIHKLPTTIYLLFVCYKKPKRNKKTNKAYNLRNAAKAKYYKQHFN